MIIQNGRRLLTRAELAKETGLSVSTLQRLWNACETNGHPPVAHREGRTLHWDADAFAAWRQPTSRRLLTRAELAEETGLSPRTLQRLWDARESNGHPPVAHREGRTLRWDADEFAAWHTALQADAGEEIGPANFARILGHKHTKWVSESARSSTPPPNFPAPDRWEDGPRGRRPIWKRARAQHYADKGRHETPPRRGRYSRQRNNPPYLYAGDPRLALARQVLAEHPDESNAQLIDRLERLADAPSSRSTWTRILAAARHTTEED
ncbi:hypothetical protein ABZ383_26435 [Streptomyces sp. NPDC005900]|uniref:hypothetical protein n=1 Tax=Streptomyces sp. NPDC005900 TaxID=3154569 RepID=UPI00340993EE